MPQKPKHTTQELQSALSSLSEGIKALASTKNREELEERVKFLVGKSLFLDESKRLRVLETLEFFSFDMLWLIKDAFIRENLRYLYELVQRNVLKREDIEVLKGAVSNQVVM